MPSRPGPSAWVIIPGTFVVVIMAWLVGQLWGAEAFIATCLIGSISAGLVITNGK